MSANQLLLFHNKYNAHQLLGKYNPREWCRRVLQKRLMRDAEDDKGEPRQRRRNRNRLRSMGHERLMRDYFDPLNSTYSDADFQRRFRMTRELFLRIQDDLCNADSYFRTVRAHLRIAQCHSTQ